MNGDSVIDRTYRIWNQFVPSELSGSLLRRGVNLYVRVNYECHKGRHDYTRDE